MIYFIIFSVFSIVSIYVFGLLSIYAVLNLIGLIIALSTVIKSYGYIGLFRGFKILIKLFAGALALIFILYLIFNIQYEKDFSRNSVFSIDKRLKSITQNIRSPITVNLIKTLKTENQIEKFYRKVKILENENLKFKKVSVEEQPVLISQKWKIKPGEVIYIENQQGRSDKISELDQAELTRGIARVNQDPIIQGCILESHSIDLDSNSDVGFSKLRVLLQDQGINLVKVNLAGVISKDCQLMIVPPMTISDDDIKKFIDLKIKVSNWWFISDPISGNLNKLEKVFNFEVGQAVIVDQSPSAGVEGLGWQILLAKVGESLITRSITSQNPAVMLMANPVSFNKGESLLYSGKSSWGETNLTDLQLNPPVADFDVNDLPGSQSALSVYDDHGQKMLIVGDLEWLRNSNVILAGNSSLVSNIGRWLLSDIQSYSDDTPGIQIISVESFNLQRLIFLIFCELFIVIGIYICRR